MFPNIFTSRHHLVVAPGWFDRNLLTGAVLQQLGHSLALPDAVQEQEVPGSDKISNMDPKCLPPLSPPGVLSEMFT